MSGGYIGKILRVNLTTGSISTIDTDKYAAAWKGGHGIGSAIFWDLVVVPGNWDMLNGFDERNVVTLMTSPLSGTTAPAVAGRCEVQGVGLQGYPIGWFTRSNFGGRFSAELKYAGWDGIVIEGKASTPVWLNIIDDDIEIRDATSEGDNLCGLDTWETQKQIWWLVTDTRRPSEWHKLTKGGTTQKPAVVAIGVSGENLCRNACLIHGAGDAAGQGGFGGVFGSKNLKAISVLGTGSVPIADPQALFEARQWYAAQNQDPLSGGLGKIVPTSTQRASACRACPAPCRRRKKDGFESDSTCFPLYWYRYPGLATTDLLQRAGLNSQDVYGGGETGNFCGGLGYIRRLYSRGIAGPGKAIDTSPLPMDDYGTLGFCNTFLDAVSNRQGIGDALAEGTVRAAEQWGRLEEDLDSGLLPYPFWGYLWHFSMPAVEWAYGSLIGDRDINEHDFSNRTFNTTTRALMTAQEIAEFLATRISPYEGDPLMFDFSEVGKYSEHMAKLVAWHRHYTRFYKQGLCYCEYAYVNFLNPNNPNGAAENWKGTTPESEHLFFNAITGNNISFVDGIEIGRKIWNLDRAIWILQGRDCDMEEFAGFMYKPGASAAFSDFINMPLYEGGQWHYPDETIGDTYIDRSSFSGWKQKFYSFEGWDSKGWPKRKTLEDLGLKDVADVLDAKGKLGQG